jgi:hypothetical protein
MSYARQSCAADRTDAEKRAAMLLMNLSVQDSQLAAGRGSVAGTPPPGEHRCKRRRAHSLSELDMRPATRG